MSCIAPAYTLTAALGDECARRGTREGVRRFVAQSYASARYAREGGPVEDETIWRCLRTKLAIVAEDEREQGRRALLNLGHTFGHALEAATQYDGRRLVHGEGVAIGMVLAHEFSARMNLCSPDDGRVRSPAEMMFFRRSP